MPIGRTELHNEVVQALIETKAVDFDAIGGVLSKFGSRAALTGSALGLIIGRHVMDLCIPPEPYINVLDLKSLASKQLQE
jgi:hypothetical protein